MVPGQAAVSVCEEEGEGGGEGRGGEARGGEGRGGEGRGGEGRERERRGGRGMHVVTES